MAVFVNDKDVLLTLSPRAITVPPTHASTVSSDLRYVQHAYGGDMVFRWILDLLW
jgi:hypothetical protein